MHFGFSYVGLIYLIMLMVLNIIWTKKQPKSYEKYAQKYGHKEMYDLLTGEEFKS